MAISITFSDEPVPDSRKTFGEPAMFGTINIGDFSERIILETTYWQPAQYQAQWASAIERVLTEPDGTPSGLITIMCDPAKPMYEFPVEVWPLHKRGKTIIIQNGFSPISKLTPPFDQHLEELYEDLVLDETANEDGQKASTWRITTADLATWLEELKIAELAK